MYATAIIPALLVTIGRFFVPESASWQLSAAGSRRPSRRREPCCGASRLSTQCQTESGPRHHLPHGPPLARFAIFFNRSNRRATILAAVPWFLQDLGTYGIGIFTPTILAASLGHEPVHARNLTDLIHNDMLAAKGAAFIDVLLLIG